MRTKRKLRKKIGRLTDMMQIFKREKEREDYKKITKNLEEEKDID